MNEDTVMKHRKFFFALLLALLLCACGQQDPEQQDPEYRDLPLEPYTPPAISWNDVQWDERLEL